MKRFALIGDPVAHSHSPQLHRAALQQHEIEGEFVSVKVTSAQLPQWMKYEAPQFDGIAVTSPHKENVLEFIHQESEATQKIGAVNTIFQKKGQLIGTNTDSIGALRALQTAVNPNGLRVLVLGAGGAARAIIFALKMTRSDITVWNRTAPRAEKLAQEFKIQYEKNLEDINPDDYNVIINATLVGMNEWKSLLSENFWQPHHTAMDVIYTPLETKFLADATQSGAKTITGDLMLVYQAVEQFRIWHGEEIDPDIMAEAFLKE
ncbi:shikimate dehydrogenase [Candidatus Gracilibacteria bacterium]|nr:shikimate dehydrogenase [Candidatus Gracilibacteria bacterium]MCF7819012.1 shikimate dehydrogenase [Candidatus Gracilibacteria bacterium]